MKLKIPADATSVSVDGREYVADEGIIDVGSLDGAAVQRLLDHAGCTMAGPDDVVAAASAAQERLRKIEVLKALAAAGEPADGRIGLKKLEEKLAQVTAKSPTP